MSSSVVTVSLLTLYIALQVGFILRALLRPYREPSARVAWVLVMLALPAVGMLAYVLFGETNIGRRRVARYREAARLFKAPQVDPVDARRRIAAVASDHAYLFNLGHSVSGFLPTTGNAARVFSDSNASIASLLDDIAAAERYVHLVFYIWLDDNNGLKVVEALKAAARRGVVVRAMADDLGSRRLVRSRHWTDMQAAGVRLAAALPIGNPLLHPIRGRVDLRNHRKIVVIDDRITYCGSQNCADPEFRVKPRYAPWIDVMLRLEGPVAGQNQRLFLQDWVSHVDDGLEDLDASAAEQPSKGSIVAQAIGTGPTVRNSAMPEVFETLMHGAREELVITTPYYVPSDSMQSALCGAGHRGVRTSLVLPAKNDSWIVGAASRSYYLELLQSNVRIFEYEGGLLHAKSLTLDREIALIGSANLDRRSFELNYENNVLLKDRALTGELRDLQDGYISRSREITMKEVTDWGPAKRLWNNSVAMMGPVL
ncbi:cardiolipin synthase [Rhodosalinus sp. 5P4]|uniref:cardiolipin synthase n=1 Tax=Rhodosalinus sp. 5P4 TaxID=3239196 RepID=UPI0035259034